MIQITYIVPGSCLTNSLDSSVAYASHCKWGLSGWRKLIVSNHRQCRKAPTSILLEHHLVMFPRLLNKGDQKEFRYLVHQSQLLSPLCVLSPTVEKRDLSIAQQNPLPAPGFERDRDWNYPPAKHTVPYCRSAVAPLPCSLTRALIWEASSSCAFNFINTCEPQVPNMHWFYFHMIEHSTTLQAWNYVRCPVHSNTLPIR